MMHEHICKIYGSGGACPESVCFGGGAEICDQSAHGGSGFPGIGQNPVLPGRSMGRRCWK